MPDGAARKKSDITTVSTGDAANSRRWRSVTPQQGGRSDITGLEKEVSKEGRKDGRKKEGRKRAGLRGQRGWPADPAHRKYSVESASAWMLSSSFPLFCLSSDSGVP